MSLPPHDGIDWLELALRFAAHAPGWRSIVVGRGTCASPRDAELVAEGAAVLRDDFDIRAEYTLRALEAGGWPGPGLSQV